MEYEMSVHPFGAVSSKNCVTFALHQTAFDNREEFGEEAMETLLDDFYVDDMLKSFDKTEEAVTVVGNTINMCGAGGFNLHKVVSTDSRLMSAIPQEKRAEKMKIQQIGGPIAVESALGVQWHLATDCFGFKISFKADDGTRRGSLATIPWLLTGGT